MELRALDERLYRCWRALWHLRFLQPENAAEERERFFADESYEPRFRYAPLPFDEAAMARELAAIAEALAPRKEGMAALLLAKARRLEAWLALLQARGSRAFSAQSRRLYEGPDEALLAEAERLLSLETLPVTPSVDTEEAARRLQEESDRLRLGIRVAVREGMAARADCVLPERTLYLRAGTRFSERDVRKLALHELGVHARRALNGEKSGWKLLLMGTAGYEEIEEGLAGLLEEQGGVSSPKSLKTKGGLVVAVDLGLRAGFRAVYERLRQHFRPETAYRLALKAKRGLGATGEAGAFTKDCIYLRGLLAARRLSAEEVERLFTGRVGLADLEALSRAGL